MQPTLPPPMLVAWVVPMEQPLSLLAVALRPIPIHGPHLQHKRWLLPQD